MNRRDFLQASVVSLGMGRSARTWALPRQLGNHDTPGAGNDGEGVARLLSPEYAVAGEPVPIAIEVTIGPNGVALGGGIAVGIHHAASWRPGFQITSPNRPGYVTVEGPPGVALEMHYEEWFPSKRLAEPGQGVWKDGIYHMVFFATVAAKRLEPGDTVVFRLGQAPGGLATHCIADPNHQFRVMTDVDGNGVYRGIAESPIFDVVAAKPHHLTAVAPAQILVGEPFELQIRAEDRYFNVVRDDKGRVGYNGVVTVRDEDGAVLVHDVVIVNGIGVMKLAVASTGPRRFHLSDGALEGRSNPCKAFDELPKTRIYWGDIHGHTGVSDGLGDSCAEFFAYGRDVARLDVCALTDHGHFDWEQNRQAVKDFHEPGRYVTLLAQEAGAGPDHVNYYFRHDDTNHVERWTKDYADLQKIILKQYNSGAEPEVIAGPHHFSYKRGDDRYPFGLWDARVMRFVELYSSHGTSEFPGNDRPLPGPTAADTKFMCYGLAQGLRFGVIASSDCHDSRPGRTIWGHTHGGLVAFLAPELTREAIWQAFWHYRTYAASMDRIYMEFRVGGQEMGGELEASGPIEVAYEVIGKTDALCVDLLRNNEVIRTDETVDGKVKEAFEDDPPDGETFYYLRATQDNGERAWSTPIWVTRA